MEFSPRMTILADILSIVSWKKKSVSWDLKKTNKKVEKTANAHVCVITNTNEV